MSISSDPAEDRTNGTMWGSATVRPDGTLSQFVLTESEAEALDLIARVFVRAPGGFAPLEFGLARLDFVAGIPPRMPGGRPPASPPLEDFQTELGEGIRMWGAIRIGGDRRLGEFVPAGSEMEAREAISRAVGSNPYSNWWAVVQIDLKTPPSGLAPAEPLANPLTALLRDQAIRPIAPDLLAPIQQLEVLFDANAKRAARSDENRV